MNNKALIIYTSKRKHGQRRIGDLDQSIRQSIEAGDEHAMR